ncbi:MAG TPA: outer membrane beta-barrel protein [Gammaproteobacteria bacterium]|nr:outer membrane beta-barrel protein [Gammaproteobacteria bacterium]
MRFSKALIILSCLPCAVMAAKVETSHYTFDVTSYAAGSYNYLVHSRYFISNALDRLNDNAENGFRIQQLYFSIASFPQEGLGGYAELTAGYDAYAIAPYGWDANMFGIQNFGFAVPDLYLQYSHASNHLMAGVMEAIAGFEEFNYLEDSNFSRGILYGYAVPGVHMGLRGMHDVDSDTQLYLGLVNGWATLRQPGHIKALEIGVKRNFTKKLNITLDGYFGSSYLTDFLFSGPSGQRTLVDMQGTYQWTDAFNINWNLDYGLQNRALLPAPAIGSAMWAGAAGFFNYQFNDKWRTSVRGEIFDDADGYRTGVAQVWKEITLTFGYEPIKHLMFNIETRRDFSNVNAFLNKGALTSNNNQQSFALEALYQFV